MFKGCECFICILWHEFTINQTHSQHKQRYMVSILGCCFQRDNIVRRFQLGKVDTRQLVLSFRMTGKGCIAQEFCAFGSLAVLKCLCTCFV